MANAPALGAGAARLVGSSPTPSTGSDMEKTTARSHKERRYAAIGLIIILGISLALRLVNIGYPAEPVFDEAHFATYAGNYLDHRAFYDIHPPLGKLIYAGVLFLASGGARFSDYQFVAFNPNQARASLYAETGIPYGSFPYVALRMTSVMFGLALIAAFYLFLRNIGVGTAGALLGAFFVALENAILLQTKLILLDGMYLAFGFLALALYFRRPRWPVAAGIIFALSLGVKLIGVVFAGPVIVDYFLRKKENQKEAWSSATAFFVAAAAAFAAIALLNLAFFPPKEILTVQNQFGFRFPQPSSARIALFFAAIASTFAAWSGYLVNGIGLYRSPWYFWPFMQNPMLYYVGAVNGIQKFILLVGNPVVWFGSTAAVLAGLAALLRPVFRGRSFEHATVTQGDGRRPFSLLFGGYLSALLPFFTVVQRDTFLYHYFPGLIFAIGLLAWFVARELKLGDISSLTRREWLWIFGIVIYVATGFLVVAPFTYGF